MGTLCSTTVHVAFHLREVHEEIHVPLAVLCYMYMDEASRQAVVSMGYFGLI